MNRRKFLAITGIGTLFGLESFVAPGAYLSMHDSQMVDVNVDTATLVGLWYLTKHPEEADRSSLLASLAGYTPEGRLLDWFTAEHLDSVFVRRASMMDYACGDVVFIGGWQLARTEARICALIAIS